MNARKVARIVAGRFLDKINRIVGIGSNILNPVNPV